MNNIFQRIWGFDRLIGPVLVKIVYYVGFAAIAIGVVGALMTALLAIVGGNIGFDQGVDRFASVLQDAGELLHEAGRDVWFGDLFVAGF